MPVTVTVLLPQPTLTVGASQAARVRVDGIEEGDTTLDARAIQWASSNPAVATVSASATQVTVAAVAPGSAQVRATVDGVTGTAPLTVSAPVVDITAAQESAIKAVPVGGVLTLRGPTTDFSVQVAG